MRGFGCDSAMALTTMDRARSTAPASVRNTPRNNSSVEQEAVVLDGIAGRRGGVDGACIAPSCWRTPWASVATAQAPPRAPTTDIQNRCDGERGWIPCRLLLLGGARDDAQDAISRERGSER